MSQRFIMTAFGKDRPGIAADVSEIMYENGCNLEDTSMTLLAGEFTLILLFTAASADVAGPLSKACRRLEQEKGISAFLRPLEPQKTVKPDNDGFTVRDPARRRAGPGGYRLQGQPLFGRQPDQHCRPQIHGQGLTGKRHGHVRNGYPRSDSRRVRTWRRWKRGCPTWPTTLNVDITVSDA
jgi:predicted amino acid-binding ACT domain protein